MSHVARFFIQTVVWGCWVGIVGWGGEARRRFSRSTGGREGVRCHVVGWVGSAGEQRVQARLGWREIKSRGSVFQTID